MPRTPSRIKSEGGMPGGMRRRRGAGLYVLADRAELETRERRRVCNAVAEPQILRTFGLARGRPWRRRSDHQVQLLREDDEDASASRVGHTSSSAVISQASHTVQSLPHSSAVSHAISPTFNSIPPAPLPDFS
eukprot:3786330-Rhodomonas_salina.1